jgi:hypothetical protein
MKMINKKFTTFLLCLFSILIFSSCSALKLMSKSSHAEWSYAIDNNTEQTQRSYLLVFAPNKPEEKRIRVVSQCKKPYPAEGAYGTCMHTVDVQPANKKLNFITGEDVVMIQFTWDAPLLLATLEYGCCGGHDTINFYSEKGDWLGKTINYNTATRVNNGNFIIRTFDLGNGTRNDKIIYFIVSYENSGGGFQALVFENGNLARRIPVVVPLPDQDMCGEWYIDNFVKYGDREYLTLKLKGMWCKYAEDVQERSYRCTAGEKSITCLPESQGVGETRH